MVAPTCPQPVSSSAHTLSSFALASCSHLQKYRQQEGVTFVSHARTNSVMVGMRRPGGGSAGYSGYAAPEWELPAAKRTRAAFGDAAPAAEQSGKPSGKEPPSAKTKIPDSPSDIGGFNPAPGRLTAEALEALPQEELMARMATMSSAQIEELLSQADF